MLEAVRSWLWPRPESPADRPPLHLFFPADEPRPDDERCWFEGRVLSAGPDGGSVSGDVWYEAAAVRGARPPAVGERVSGEARRGGAERGWLALHVQLLDDEWEAEPRPTAERRLVGQVCRFEGDVLVLADRDTEYRLRHGCASVDFVPQKGDWLELESDSAIPLEVTASDQLRVRPLRRWDLDGQVTLVSHESPVFGLIDNQVYFQSSAWLLPRLPRRGDRVRCSAVESSQTIDHGVTINWRAVRVAPLEARAWLRAPAAVAPTGASATPCSTELLQDKCGVSVTFVGGGGDFGRLRCGESRRTTLLVRNTGAEDATLAARLLSDADGQFAVTAVTTPEEAAASAEAVPLPAGGQLQLAVECRARLLGAGRALCLLDFGTFRIGRWLSVTVEDPDQHRLTVGPAAGRRFAAVTSELDARQGCVVVPGQPAFRPAPFVSARLAPFPLPPRLLAMDADRLLLTYPCLADQLTADNYRQRLSLLLFIEEAEMMRQVRQFDMTGIALTQSGDCLQLVVPGLAEGRPSLVVGDKVLLSHPFEESGLKYEGHVHEVRHSALRLRFHPDFQRRYSGQEYNAQFEFSRSQLRQLHRAVETAVARLGSGVLFPSRVVTRLPQARFVEEFCRPRVSAVCCHCRRVESKPGGPVPAPASTVAGACSEPGGVATGQWDEGPTERAPAGLEDQPVTAEAARVGSLPESPAGDDLPNGITVQRMSLKDVAINERSVYSTPEPSHRFSASRSVPAGDSRVSDQSKSWPPGDRLVASTPVALAARRRGGQSAADADASSVTSDSDTSFTSAECSLDGSHYVSACGSVGPGAGSRSRSRSRRVAVVDRLFGPAGQPVNGAGMTARLNGERSERVARPSSSGARSSRQISRVSGNCGQAPEESENSRQISEESGRLLKTPVKPSTLDAVGKSLLRNSGNVIDLSERGVADLKSESLRIPLACDTKSMISAGSDGVRATSAVCSDGPIASVRSDRIQVTSVRLDEIPITSVRSDKASLASVKSDEASVSAVRSDVASVSAVRLNEASVGAVGSNVASVSAVGSDEASVSAVRSNVASVSAVGSDEIDPVSVRSGEIPITARKTAPITADAVNGRSPEAAPTAPPPAPATTATPPAMCRCGWRRAAAADGHAAGQPAPFVVPRASMPPPPPDTARGAAQFCVPRLEPTSAADRPGLRLLNWFNQRLNDRQRSAVRRVLKGTARPLPYIIYGPPGSGKTVTVVECILQIYTMCPNSRVLVATPSNSAADLITERLHGSGALHSAAMVRLTSFNRSEESCPEVVRPYVMSGDSLEAASRRRIVVGTSAAVGNLYRLGLRQGHFTHVLVDEAGHMTEPETLVPLSLVSALDGQAVLAGDPQQLGPVLQSRYASAWGMQTSMLERLSERPLYGRHDKFADHGCYNPLLVTKLVNNYRSHSDLLTVPSRLYYHSELVPCVDSQLATKWCHLEFLPRRGFPLLFHGVRGENVQEGDSPSWFNPTEAFQVIRYLQKLGSAGVDWDEVGVISPYRKQTEKIRELINTFGLPTVKVGSVEEFQGQEREVIILTTVRSSEITLSHDIIYRLGFMQNRRRFNVAITRAKCLLVVVGNPHLLAADPHWRQLVEYAVTNGGAIGCDGVL